MGIYVAGAAGVAVFYAAVLGVGIWAAAMKRKKLQTGQNDMILANRDLGLCLGIFTLVATWVGGAFVNGSAEAVYTRGLAWCQVPIGYSLSLLFGALLFVKPMRKAEYVTMLDPFQQRYGAGVGGLLFLPALFGDLFWCGAVLRALGSSLSVVAGVDPTISVCTSALLATIYTVSGGLYSVACTDALQLVCIALGLAISAPYAALHPAVSFEKSLMSTNWMGEMKNEDLGLWLDGVLLLIFGGIPWQGYFQRILSIRSTSVARTLSIVSMFGCLAMAVPSITIGIIARATDWSLVDGYNKTLWMDSGSSVLPLVLRYLTPPWVSFVGLGAISAAVMSSADSSILASSSMFSRNVYKITIRPKASEKELVWILRIAVIVISTLSAVVALTVKSVYYLSFMCSDLVYVVLFPQLLSVVHWPSLVDTYGCLAGYIVAVIMRIGGGEKVLGIPTIIEYPYYDHSTHTQKFPFRTAAMLAAIFTQLFVSFVTRNVLGKGYFPRCCDFLNVYAHGNKNQVVQSNSGAALVDSTLHDSSSGHISDAPSENDRPDFGAVIDRQRYETVSVLYDSKSSSAIHKANQSLQNIQNLQKSAKSPGTKCRPSPVVHNCSGQILGVKSLALSHGQLPDRECHGHIRVISPTTPTANALYTKPPAPERIRENDRMGDRSNMELNLNLNHHDGVGIINKKNIKGVKLVGMEGGTLRRPSLQVGTFSPTPSVELVNIFDRRQSSGSFGPTSLSPVPGVEACKTHGTAAHGQHGNEHCKIKRGIVRHHSFNDTADRGMTTLARQPTYPSMPLRPEDCRMTLRKEKRPHVISRYSSVMDEKGLNGTILVSPTYSMYNSAVKNCNYFVADDEAVSRF